MNKDQLAQQKFMGKTSANNQSADVFKILLTFC